MVAGSIARPVIVPPQTLILCMGRPMDRVIMENGEVKNANFLNLSASADHRFIDGAYLARFMKMFKDVIENPEMLL